VELRACPYQRATSPQTRAAPTAASVASSVKNRRSGSRFAVEGANSGGDGKIACEAAMSAHSSEDDAGDASGIGTGAGRRRAGTGPEYHLREMYMKSGAARKIDE
jgi:hypothetical protein